MIKTVETKDSIANNTFNKITSSENFKQYDPLDRNVEIFTNKKLVEQLNLNRGN
jgi:hypothetical protein